MHLEPSTQKFIDELAAGGGPPIYELTPAAARNVLSDAQGGLIEVPPANIEDRTIPVGPKGVTRIRIVRPMRVQESMPVVMYFHGGGWILGGVDTHDRLIRELAVGANAALVFVDYSRSPESQYPTTIEECFAATQWIAAHGHEMGLDGSRLAIAGDSVGGNMVAVVALLAKRRRGPDIRSQLLFYPVTDANFDTGSYDEFADGPWLTREAMKWFWDAYLPNAKQRKDATVSPLRASVEDLKGQPPALVITDENDVLRDEGEAYAHKLAQAGVDVTAVRYLGTIHDFMMLNGLRHTPAAQSAVTLASGVLRAALVK